MERSDLRTEEWVFEIRVLKAPFKPLRILFRERNRDELSFASWEALYRYLSDRFPEAPGYLR